PCRLESQRPRGRRTAVADQAICRRRPSRAATRLATDRSDPAARSPAFADGRLGSRGPGRRLQLRLALTRPFDSAGQWRGPAAPLSRSPGPFPAMSTAAREALDHKAVPWLFTAALVTIAPHFEHQPLWL